MEGTAPLRGRRESPRAALLRSAPLLWVLTSSPCMPSSPGRKVCSLLRPLLCVPHLNCQSDPADDVSVSSRAWDGQRQIFAQLPRRASVLGTIEGSIEQKKILQIAMHDIKPTCR